MFHPVLLDRPEGDLKCDLHVFPVDGPDAPDVQLGGHVGRAAVRVWD